tara:strand:+ start:401 stop:886 length:486 start_codon:yes stop_codon:yes gene_type:complete
LRDAFSWPTAALWQGDEAGALGQMCNVVRVFNVRSATQTQPHARATQLFPRAQDDIGVELTSRTGRNPQYSYLRCIRCQLCLHRCTELCLPPRCHSLGCSKNAEARMLQYAKTLVGKPFSNTGMARSIVYPRTTTGESFFCAGMYHLRHSTCAHFPKAPTM